MRLLRDKPWLGFGWTLLLLFGLYRLWMLLGGERLGLLAAGFYGLLSSQVWLWGQTAETELFANLWRVTAVYNLLLLLQKRAM
jgi:hypothetical protein